MTRPAPVLALLHIDHESSRIVDVQVGDAVAPPVLGQPAGELLEVAIARGDVEWRVVLGPVVGPLLLDRLQR